MKAEIIDYGKMKETKVKYNKDNKSDKDKSLKNKKELMEKFIKQTTIVNKSETETTPKESYKKKIDSDEIFKYKEEINKLKKQVEIEKDKRKAQLKNNNKLEYKIKNLTKEYDCLTAENNNIKTLNDNLNNKCEKYLKEINVLKQFETQIATKDDCINKLNNQISQLKEHVLNLNNQIKEQGYKTELRKKCKEIDELENFLKESDEKINTLKRGIKYLEYNNKLIKARVKISELSENDNYIDDNIRYIEIAKRKLTEKTKEIKYKIYNEYRRIKRNIKINANLKKKRGNIEYGTIYRKNLFRYVFKTTDGDEYKVFRKSMKNKGFKEGSVCMGTLSKEYNKIWVKYVYYKEGDYLNHLNMKKAKKDKTTVKIQTDKDNIKERQLDFKVLIITALNVDKYTNKLSDVGIDVSYFNSYYENAKRLSKILSKYDMVFYCVRHSRHYCKDIINNQPDVSDKDKYNIITDDSVNNILRLIDKRIERMENDLNEKINGISDN